MKYIPILSLNFHALYAGLMYMLCGLVGVKLGREAFDVVRCLVLVMAHCFGSVPCVLAGLARLVVLFMFLPIAPASFKPPVSFYTLLMPYFPRHLLDPGSPTRTGAPKRRLSSPEDDSHVSWGGQVQREAAWGGG